MSTNLCGYSFGPQIRISVYIRVKKTAFSTKSCCKLHDRDLKKRRLREKTSSLGEVNDCNSFRSHRLELQFVLSPRFASSSHCGHAGLSFNSMQHGSLCIVSSSCIKKQSMVLLVLRLLTLFTLMGSEDKVQFPGCCCELISHILPNPHSIFPRCEGYVVLAH